MNVRDFSLQMVGYLIFAMASASLEAAQPFFLPGDAFFSGRINTRIKPDVPIDGTLLLHYEWPEGFEGLMKYTYGTLRLKLTGITAENWKAWEQGIQELRKSDRETLTVIRKEGEDSMEEVFEENPLYVFVYPKSFKITEFRPFMRYNENWSDECTALGVPVNEQSLPSFYRDLEQREWRDAKFVPCLPVTFGSREGEKADRRPRSFSEGSIGRTPSSYPDNRDAASFPYEKANIILVAGRILRQLRDNNDLRLMPEEGESIIVIHDNHWEEYFSTGKNWSLSRDPE